jgi:predicted membrane chloride channel (bestrophin family)
VFFGLDALGDERQAPFDKTESVLPLGALLRTIEIAVAQTLGSAEIPPAIEPAGFILS